MKIACVVGARPQFIKEAPVGRLLRRDHEEILVHTGQHYDEGLSAKFFKELEIPEPAYNLGVGSGSHGEQTGKMLAGLENVFATEEPDFVLVYGDTNSTLAGSLAAAKLHIPVGHVEAGYRSRDRKMPEEINRICTDHVSDLLFAPTPSTFENLKTEGVTEGVHLVGDVQYDALLQNIAIARKKSKILKDLKLKAGKFFLATVHRPASTDDPRILGGIIDAFNALPHPVVFPVHPRTRARLREHGLLSKVKEHVFLMEPVGYFDLLALTENALRILTDSGGVQKEAYLLEKPCVMLRDTNEITEIVNEGWNVLVGHDTEKIVDAALNFTPPKKRGTPFGHGNASEHIARLINEWPESGKTSTRAY